MAHDVHRGTWEITKGVPERCDPVHIEEPVTLSEAVLNPVVVVPQVSAAPTAFEAATTCVDFAKSGHELRKLSSQREAVARARL